MIILQGAAPSDLKKKKLSSCDVLRSLRRRYHAWPTSTTTKAILQAYRRIGVEQRRP